MRKIESTANVYLAAALIAVVVVAFVAAYVIIRTEMHVTYPKFLPSVASTQAPIASDSSESENFTPSLTTTPLPQTSVPLISPPPTITPSLVPTPALTPLLLPTITLIPTPIPTIPPTPTPTSTLIPTLTPSPTPTSTPTPPSTQTVTKSENWAGYAVASDLQNPQPTVTGVSASWTVPSVAPNSTDAFSAIWIGVGGKFDRTLIQCGTEQDSVGGQIHYSAWYELLPRNSKTISTINVSAGDEIKASIQLSNQTADEWSINITDLTSGQSFQITVTYASSQLSAEWIVERPTVNRALSPLANFGTISLSNCTATVGSATGGIGSLPANEIIMYSSIASSNSTVQLTNVSGFSVDEGGFAVDYLASN